MKKYTIRCKVRNEDRYYTKKVDGIPVKILDGFEFFAHETETSEGNPSASTAWTVSEKSSGWSVCKGPTMDETVAKAKETVLADPERSRKLFNEAIEKNKVLFTEKS